jgi:hypothetical protein
MKLRHLLLILAVASSATLFGAGQQTGRHLISMHLEGNETETTKFVTPVKLGSEHRQYFFRKIPEFTARDIQWFYPFTAADGVSYGAAFKLKPTAANRLKDVTLVNHGKLLAVRCSDALPQVVVIDRPIDDGVVVVWEGLQQRHLKEFRKQFPHVDDLGDTRKPVFAQPQ